MESVKRSKFEEVISSSLQVIETSCHRKQKICFLPSMHFIFIHIYIVVQIVHMVDIQWIYIQQYGFVIFETTTTKTKQKQQMSPEVINVFRICYKYCILQQADFISLRSVHQSQLQFSDVYLCAINKLKFSLYISSLPFHASVIFIVTSLKQSLFIIKYMNCIFFIQSHPFQILLRSTFVYSIHYQPSFQIKISSLY